MAAMTCPEHGDRCGGRDCCCSDLHLPPSAIDHDWRYVDIRRKVTGSGVGVLTIAHKDGRVVEMPLFPETLRLMAVEAITAMAPDSGS